MRTLYRTPEFDEFLNSADDAVKEKMQYLLDIVANQPVITAKIAKKLTNTDLYEIRIQVNNEYRSLCFTIDHSDINQAREIVLISGFMKKSTKDYDKQIKKALKILEEWTDQK